MRRGLAVRCAVLAAVGCVVLQAAPPTATAQGDEAEAIDLEKLASERARRAQLHPVRARISRYLSAAAEQVDEGNSDEATRLLLKLRPNRLNPYERALVYRMLAFVSYGAEKPEEAIAYFEKVLDEEILPLRDESRIRFNIAQLYAGLQRWQAVIDSLEQWLRYEASPDPLGYYLMGISYYELEDLDAAIEATEMAVDLSDQPKEPWLRLLAAIFAQKEDYASATPVLEELMLRYPKKQYWLQLALIYGAREDYRRSLAVQQIAYLQGYIDESKDLLRLARSYLFNEMPHPAAQVLEKGLASGIIVRDVESLELLANSWIAAREYDRSLSPLRQAAELSEDGKIFVRLGQVYMQREEWSEAADRLKQALAKGSLEDPGNAELLLGIAYYNDRRLGPARSSFVRARGYDSTRAEADRWLTHIANEREQG